VRQQRKDETAERVRRAAWELFSDVGYAATTTKAIAERAGVAAGTVFVHATDKADLLRAVVYAELEARVDELAGGVGEGALVDEWMRMFSRLLGFYAQHRRVAEAFLSVSMSPSLEAKHSAYGLEVTTRFVGVLAGLVERAKGRGDVRRDVGSVLVAHAAFALYFSVLTAWLQGFASIDGASASLRDLLELLVRGLGPGVGEPAPPAPLARVARPRRAKAPRRRA